MLRLSLSASIYWSIMVQEYIPYVGYNFKHEYISSSTEAETHTTSTLGEFRCCCGSEFLLDMELHAQPGDITHKAVEVLDRPRPHTKG